MPKSLAERYQGIPLQILYQRSTVLQNPSDDEKRPSTRCLQVVSLRNVEQRPWNTLSLSFANGTALQTASQSQLISPESQVGILILQNIK